MSKRILIVEDEFVVANALRLTLVEAGYTVEGIAVSAEEAEERFLQGTPDLVLLDIRLNGKRSGIDLAKRLQAEHIPFIYLSANSSQKVLEEAKATEPYGFLVKPYREKDCKTGCLLRPGLLSRPVARGQVPLSTRPV